MNLHASQEESAAGCTAATPPAGVRRVPAAGERAEARVLLVESDREAIAQLCTALGRIGQVSLRVAMNAVQATDVLRLTCRTSPPELPDLIILDLRLPVFHGSMVLDFLAQRPELRRIPVVVLTPGPGDNGRLRHLDQGRRLYLPKPGSWSEWLAVMTPLLGMAEAES